MALTLNWQRIALSLAETVGETDKELAEAKSRGDYFCGRWLECISKNVDLKRRLKSSLEAFETERKARRNAEHRAEELTEQRDKDISQLEAKNKDLERMLVNETRHRQELQGALEAQGVGELLTRLKNQSATIARLQSEVEGLTHALRKQKESVPLPSNPPEIRVTVTTECRALSLNCKLQASYVGHDYYRGEAGTALQPCVVRLYVPNTACPPNN